MFKEGLYCLTCFACIIDMFNIKLYVLMVDILECCIT